MTGLYNRTYFEEELDRLDQRRDGVVGILVTDVDGLKLVNDTLGYEEGDALLVETARVLEEVVRKSDMVARIGGDEFTILLPGADEASMEGVVERNHAALRKREEKSDPTRSVVPRLSLGHWAISADSGTPMRTAFRVADDRMYGDKLRRKGSGRNAFLRTITTLLSERGTSRRGAPRAAHRGVEQHRPRPCGARRRCPSVGGGKTGGELDLFVQHHVVQVVFPDAVDPEILPAHALQREAEFFQ